MSKDEFIKSLVEVGPAETKKIIEHRESLAAVILQGEDDFKNGRGVTLTPGEVKDLFKKSFKRRPQHEK